MIACTTILFLLFVVCHGHCANFVERASLFEETDACKIFTFEININLRININLICFRVTCSFGLYFIKRP